MSLRDDLRAAAARLAQAGVGSPDADSVELAAHVLGISGSEVRRLAVLGRDPLSGEPGERYDALVGERARRVPLQHLTGRAAFRRLNLAVGPGVFVPRPETELLAGLGVAAAAATIATAAAAAAAVAPVVVDLCTGSGAVALAVKDEVPQAAVTGVELSPEAYAWACRNRDDLGLDVTLLRADARGPVPELAALEGAVDVVLANPPYIPEGAVPQDPEARDHDPALALYGGSADGLAVPLAVAEYAARLLRPGGLFAMEHADVQGEAVVAALAAQGWWDEVADHVDLNGRPRCVTAVRRVRGGAPPPR